MKKIGLAFVLTVLIFFFSLTIAPIISNKENLDEASNIEYAPIYKLSKILFYW